MIILSTLVTVTAFVVIGSGYHRYMQCDKMNTKVSDHIKESGKQLANQTTEAFFGMLTAIEAAVVFIDDKIRHPSSAYIPIKDEDIDSKTVTPLDIRYL